MLIRKKIGQVLALAMKASSVTLLPGKTSERKYLNQRTYGPVNAHLISWPRIRTKHSNNR